MGGHPPGSPEFELVTWSQGEVRHNYARSPGAPENATNVPASAERRQRLYVIGALVDLETSLRNLNACKDRGGDYHKAMVARVNTARKKVDGILAKVPAPRLSSALEAVPSEVSESTEIGADVAKNLATAVKQFAAGSDVDLGAIQSEIGTGYKGTASK